MNQLCRILSHGFRHGPEAQGILIELNKKWGYSTATVLGQKQVVGKHGNGKPPDEHISISNWDFRLLQGRKGNQFTKHGDIKQHQATKSGLVVRNSPCMGSIYVVIGVQPTRIGYAMTAMICFGDMTSLVAWQWNMLNFQRVTYEHWRNSRIRRTKGDTISGVLKQSWMYIEYGSKLFRVTGSQNLEKGLAVSVLQQSQNALANL